MRRIFAMALLLVTVAAGGTLAFRVHAQQTPVKRVDGAQRILIADASAQAPPAAAPAAAPVPVQPPGPVHVVTFVDITPLNKDNGTAICKQYAADTRKDAGVTSVQVLAQTNRPNHLVIYEVWQNEAAFEKHEALAHTKDFRAKMGPIIGSPFDQRPHYVVP